MLLSSFPSLGSDLSHRLDKMTKLKNVTQSHWVVSKVEGTGEGHDGFSYQGKH